MKITIIDKKGNKQDLDNESPDVASGNSILAFFMFGGFVAIFLIFVLSMGSTTGFIQDDGMLLFMLLPIFGFIIAVVFNLLGGEPGFSKDIVFDQISDEIRIDDKDYKFKDINLYYKSTNYNNPITEARFDETLMNLIIKTKERFYEVRMRMDLFIELKDELEKADISLERMK